MVLFHAGIAGNRKKIFLWNLSFREKQIMLLIVSAEIVFPSSCDGHGTDTERKLEWIQKKY